MRFLRGDWMYDIINNIIGHEWISNYSNEQQYIYYIAGSLILLLTVIFVDVIRDIIRSFTRG